MKQSRRVFVNKAGIAGIAALGNLLTTCTGPAQSEGILLDEDEG